MELRDLKFLKSINPIEFLDKPNKETIEFVAQFLNNTEYKDLIVKIRTNANFPETGLDLTPFIGMNLADLPLEQTILLRDSLYLLANNLRVRMNLPESFTQQVYLLVFFNTIIDVDWYEGFISDKVEFAVTKQQIVSKLFDYKHEVGAIFIPYNLSFNNFMKQAKEVWKKLQTEMDSNLTDNPYELRIHQNTELAMKITTLREEEKLTFSKIAETVFPENHPRFGDELYVKKLYYEYQALWKTPVIQQETK